MMVGSVPDSWPSPELRARGLAVILANSLVAESAQPAATIHDYPRSSGVVNVR